MKMFILALMTVAVCSCSITGSDDMADVIYASRAKGHTLYYDEAFNDIKTLKEVSDFIITNIDYAYDDGDEWSDPETTMLRGYGDCDDFAILAMNIAYYALGIKLDFVLVYVNIKSVVNGGKINHATVLLDGIVLDVYHMDNYLSDQSIGYMFTFEEVFN